MTFKCLCVIPLGPPGAECQRSSQESHKVHLVETGVQLCFDVLWLPQKKKPEIPSVDQHQVRILHGRSMFKGSSDSYKGAISS